MSLSCYVEGTGEALSNAQLRALAEWINELSERFEWDCEAFRMTTPGRRATTKLEVYTKLQQSQDTDFDRDLCQCVELTYRLSQHTPGWIWNVSDDIQCIEMSIGGSLYIRDGETVSRSSSGEFVHSSDLGREMRSMMGQSMSLSTLDNAPKHPKKFSNNYDRVMK